MGGQSELIDRLLGWAGQAGDIALGWLVSPAAWSQFGLLAVALGVALVITRRLHPPLARVLLTSPEARGLLANMRRQLSPLVPLSMPLLAYPNRVIEIKSGTLPI
jgi:hypothetical protein